jgi:hypothetical protein
MADGARVEPAAAHENHVRSDKVSETWRKAHRLYTSPALSAPFNINTSLIFSEDLILQKNFKKSTMLLVKTAKIC